MELTVKSVTPFAKEKAEMMSEITKTTVHG
jgi:hypothetical protein